VLKHVFGHEVIREDSTACAQKTFADRLERVPPVCPKSAADGRKARSSRPQRL
jgi:hypothetical protein